MRGLVILLLGFTLVACSSAPKIYRKDIHQGNEITLTQFHKIKPGLTKEQVHYLLGSPVLDDPFKPNTWHYLCVYQPAHGKATKKKIVLVFDDNNKLVRISNKGMERQRRIDAAKAANLGNDDA